ncbi:MAG: N-acetylmuramoyl-L-alanine amidase [Alphaproteobacteria bacterium]
MYFSGPDIPSILVESGFMTNRTDEKLLRSKAHRVKLATAILKAVIDIFLRVIVYLAYRDSLFYRYPEREYIKPRSSHICH